jgi:hypothetical protein
MMFFVSLSNKKKILRLPSLLVFLCIAALPASASDYGPIIIVNPSEQLNRLDDVAYEASEVLERALVERFAASETGYFDDMTPGDILAELDHLGVADSRRHLIFIFADINVDARGDVFFAARADRAGHKIVYLQDIRNKLKGPVIFFLANKSDRFKRSSIELPANAQIILFEGSQYPDTLADFATQAAAALAGAADLAGDNDGTVELGLASSGGEVCAFLKNFNALCASALTEPVEIIALGSYKPSGDTLEAIEKEKIKSAEREKVEAAEREKAEAAERERAEAERLEAEKVAQETLEKKRQAKEKERLRRERLAREKAEREARLAREKAEKERLAREKAELEARLAREKAEKERLAREQAELKARLAREKAEREALERERAERERAEKEKKTKKNVIMTF